MTEKPPRRRIIHVLENIRNDLKTGMDVEKLIEKLDATIEYEKAKPRQPAPGKLLPHFSSCPHPRDDGKGPAHTADNCPDPTVEMVYVERP